MLLVLLQKVNFGVADLHLLLGLCCGYTQAPDDKHAGYYQSMGIDLTPSPRHSSPEPESLNPLNL